MKVIISHTEATNSDASHLISLGFDISRPIKHEIIGVEHHLSQEDLNSEAGEDECQMKTSPQQKEPKTATAKAPKKALKK